MAGFACIPYMKKTFTTNDYCGYTTFRQRQILPLRYKGKKECRKSIIPTANICDSSYYCLIFRVKGISGLRIVDGSVMRSETGNINAPIIMIAEKVSDLIRGKNTGESFKRQIRSLDL
jgi:hypothetical protein